MIWLAGPKSRFLNWNSIRLTPVVMDIAGTGIAAISF
jgi:hypothetical protein